MKELRCRAQASASWRNAIAYRNWLMVMTLRDAITAAGLPLDCQPHGLRKAAGRRLAEAGCTAHEIMAVLGHKTLAEAERYTRGGGQTRPAPGPSGSPPWF